MRVGITIRDSVVLVDWSYSMSHSQPHIPRRSKMKEMRLFEIGFKEDPQRTGYEEKVNVAAENAHEAEDKARAHILEKYIDWWEETGREDDIDYRTGEGEDTSVPAMSKALDERLEGIRGMHLAKLYDVGTLIV